MGRYEVATDLATAPSSEINQPLLSVLFPVMAKAQHDRTQLKHLYLTVLYWSLLICSSSAVGIALVTSEMVDLVLGPKWVDAKPLLPWLALAYGIAGPSFTAYSTFDAIGKPHISARLTWIAVAAYAASIVVAAFVFKSVLAIAIARFAVSCVSPLVLFYFLIRELELRIVDIAYLSARPLAASVVMAAVVFAVQSALHPGSLRLFIEVVAGAATYTACILVLWQLIGAPRGPEAVLIENVKLYLNKLRVVNLARSGIADTSPKEM